MKEFADKYLLNNTNGRRVIWIIIVVSLVVGWKTYGREALWDYTHTIEAVDDEYSQEIYAAYVNFYEKMPSGRHMVDYAKAAYREVGDRNNSCEFDVLVSNIQITNGLTVEANTNPMISLDYKRKVMGASYGYMSFAENVCGYKLSEDALEMQDMLTDSMHGDNTLKILGL